MLLRGVFFSIVMYYEMMLLDISCEFHDVISAVIAYWHFLLSIFSRNAVIGYLRGIAQLGDFISVLITHSYLILILNQFFIMRYTRFYKLNISYTVVCWGRELCIIFKNSTVLNLIAFNSISCYQYLSPCYILPTSLMLCLDGRPTQHK